MRQLQLTGLSTATERKTTPISAHPALQRKGPPPLWLAIHLPELPLEVFDTADRRERPAVVVEEQGGRMRIVTASSKARKQGVETGMELRAACALCRDLVIYPRDLRAEQCYLEQLAGRAGRFTPQVVLEPPQALLLEIGGSLRLFGGIDSLWQRLRHSLTKRPLHLRYAVTSTPLASLWLARSNRSRVILSPQALRPALGELPVTILELEPRLERRLHRSGIQTLRDLWRLPRKGITRRFGPDLLQTLDRALGLEDDPRCAYIAPLSFRATLELPMESREILLIREAAKRLLARLTRFLWRHDAATEHLRFGLQSSGKTVHWLDLQLCQGSRDGKRLLELFELRLERTRLDDPVRALWLESLAIRPLKAGNRSLFHTLRETLPPEERWYELLDQLQSRLGENAVFSLQSLPEFRPERAWCRATPGDPKPTYGMPRRPLWLLPEPRPLLLRNGAPSCGGILTLQEGPERIESGWWSGIHVRRDYYVAQGRDGQRLWLFHDLTHPGRWYLHGVFG